ncbi:MAG: hypothetical protein CFE21_09185 [Bacteroidetes bacterium B1(2017)]|nr:MAG: hypothetical protein CFE21_09185 [Bacteroidetes bacterium B1(2017)]
MKHLTNIFLLATLLTFNSSCVQTTKTETDKETISKNSSNDSNTFKETPQKLKTIVDKISKINEVQQEHVGFGGSESENFKNFKQLKEIATTGELVLLTGNKNATVACYASWALADKSCPDLSVIFKKFIMQDRQVETFSGCIKSQDNISSELYHRYWNYIDDTKKPTDKILIQLDSIILFSQNPYWLLMTRAMENRVYQEPYKRQIAILAFQQGNRDAIYYLCNWHKAEYADKIKTALVQYLNKTAFKNTGTTDYYRTIEELFKFKDPQIRKLIISKMKKDRHWEMEKERFKYLLEDNNIYNIESE